MTALASLLDYSARLGVNLVVTPILVGGLGRSLFGVWQMLGQMIGYMSATDGRPTEALRLMISNHQGIEDAGARRRWVGSALVVWLVFLPLVAGAGTLLVWLSPVVTKVASGLHSTIRLTAALLVLAYLMSTLAAIPESVLRGMNLGYKRMGLQAGLDIVGGLLVAGAVSAGLGLMGVGASQILLAALTGLCFWMLVRKYVTGFGVARPNGPEVSALLRMSVWLTAGQVITQVLLASDVIILGLVVSTSDVTTYVLTGYAAKTAIGAFAFTVGAAMPGFGGLLGQRQYERAAAVRGEIMTLTWLFVTAVGTTILLWNRSFIALWVGAQHYAGFWVNLLLVCITVQTAFIRGDAYIIDAALRPRLRVLVTAAAAVLTTASALALTPSLGMVGLCLGILAGRAIQSVAYPLLVGASLHISRRLPFARLARPFAVMLLLLGVAAYLGQQIVARGWLQWAACVGLSFVLTLGLALFAGLAPAARRAVIARVRALPRAVRG